MELGFPKIVIRLRKPPYQGDGNNSREGRFSRETSTYEATNDFTDKTPSHTKFVMRLRESQHQCDGNTSREGRFSVEPSTYEATDNFTDKTQSFQNAENRTSLESHEAYAISRLSNASCVMEVELVQGWNSVRTRFGYWYCEYFYIQLTCQTFRVEINKLERLFTIMRSDQHNFYRPVNSTTRWPVQLIARVEELKKLRKSLDMDNDTLDCAMDLCFCRYRLLSKWCLKRNRSRLNNTSKYHLLRNINELISLQRALPILLRKIEIRTNIYKNRHRKRMLSLGSFL